jgi:hypothetical protein
MPNVQIRYVPEDVHRALKEQAKADGGSLNDYLLKVLADAAGQMTMRQWLDRAKARGPLWDPVPAEETVRLIKEGREERDRRIQEAIDRRRSSS